MSDSENEAATVAATMAATTQRIEIVGERRRAHDAAFRARVLTEAMASGARVQEVARRHGICASLIYRWRRVASPEAGAGSAVRLLPVRVTEPRPPEKRAPPARAIQAAEPRQGGLIEIELNGGIRVRVDGDVSLTALRRVITALRG
jgi:transposase